MKQNRTQHCRLERQFLKEKEGWAGGMPLRGSSRLAWATALGSMPSLQGENKKRRRKRQTRREGERGGGDKEQEEGGGKEEDSVLRCW